MTSIKSLKPTFKFVGEFVEIKDLINKEGVPYAKELVVYDKDMESKVGLRVFNGNEAKYWDSANSKMVTVTSDIQNTMNKVKANGTGRPLSFTVIGNNAMEIYTNDEFIACVSKLKKGNKVKIEGSVTFKQYKGKVQREYSIKKLYVLSSKNNEELGLYITTPMVFHRDAMEAFKIRHYKHILTTLVGTKLENGGFGYRPVNLAVDKKFMLNGLVMALTNEQINGILENTFSELPADCDYGITNIVGRLKAGEISRKPTEEDLNPMELAILKLKGQEVLKDKLNSMEEISTYFDDLFFNIVDFSTGKFSEKVNKSELNLMCDEVTPSVSSNPMLEALNAFKTPEPVVEEKKEEVKEEIKMDNITSLEDLVSQAENTTVENNVKEDEDEFPF